MEITASYADSLRYLLQTPPADEIDANLIVGMLSMIESLGIDAVDITETTGVTGLLELEVPGEIAVYGVLMWPRKNGLEAVAYWRNPAPPNFDRTSAINRAIERR